MSPRTLLLTGLVCLLLGACASEGPAGTDDGQPGAVSADLPLFRQWSPRVAQGGQPTAEGLADLAAKGFTTVVSVDGALPDVETARGHGLRTVHVPLGYDGIDREEALVIVKAVQDAGGPVYVHCHHGKHRGPAAAQIARMAVDGVTAERAEADLTESGCSKDYAGLYRDVRGFEPPGAEELEEVTELPSQVPPQGVRAAMVDVDRVNDRLKACQEAGWKTPSDHPDVVPQHEALLLREAYRELARTEDASRRGTRFTELLGRAEQNAETLERALKTREDMQVAFDAVRADCTTCHREFRND